MTEKTGAEHTYLERRRRRRLRRLALLALAVATFVVVVAARRPDVDDPCDVSAAPPAETALMPAGLSFDRVGTVTDVRKDERHVTVEAVTTKPLDESTVLIQDAVTAAGYRPAGMDSEGSEAEVFFTTGSYAAGHARVEQSTCEGRWDIVLVLLDRNVAASETTSRS